MLNCNAVYKALNCRKAQLNSVQALKILIHFDAEIARFSHLSIDS